MMNRLVILLVLALALISCQEAPPRDATTVFSYNESAGVSSLDPAFARNQANIWVCHQLFSNLVKMNDKLEVEPDLAKYWEVLDSGKTYRFTLRNDVLFWDDPCFENGQGRKLTADDVKWSLERLQDPDLAAPGAWVLNQVHSIKTPSDSVIEIHLSKAFAPFLGILSMKYCSVLAPEASAYYGKAIGEHPVGTGPFYLKLWLPNERMVLRRNPNYYEKDTDGNSLPYLEAAVISFISDKQSAFLEFLKGGIDFISGLDASYKDELLDQEGNLQSKYQDKLNVFRQAYLNTEYLAFYVDSNASHPDSKYWSNKHLRQALNYSFDRRKMLKYLRNNIGEPAELGMIPKGLPSYKSDANYGYNYNPAKADSLLELAGYPKGEGLPELLLQTNSSYLDLCEYLQGEASKLGFKIKVELSPPSTLRQSMATGKSPFFRASWIADYPDGENYLSLFYSANLAPEGPNYSHFYHPQFDRWYREASIETSDSLRQLLYRKMDSLVMEEAPVVPLYYDQVLRFYPKEIRGLEGNALNLLDLRRVQKN